QAPTTPTNLRPQGVAVNWNGTQVFVACATGQVVMLEGTPTSRYSATRNILLSGSVAPQNIAVASDQQNTTVYVTDPSGNRLFFFSPAQGTQSAEVRDIQGSPWGLAVGRNPQTGRQDRLYVTARTGNALYPLTLPDLSTATSGGQGVSVEGKEPTYVAVSPQGNEVYVALTGSNNIAVFKRVGQDLARPEVYQMQQLDPNFNAPTGDLGLAPFLSQ
ncbi:MAG: YncE family protein, partial [Candidatus Sericytochromatia bacterium]